MVNKRAEEKKSTVREEPSQSGTGGYNALKKGEQVSGVGGAQSKTK